MPRGTFHPTISLTATGDDRGEGMLYAVAQDVAATSDMVVSAVRVSTNGRHAQIQLWNRGGLAGTLIVLHEDRLILAARMLRVKAVDLPLRGETKDARLLK